MNLYDEQQLVGETGGYMVLHDLLAMVTAFIAIMTDDDMGFWMRPLSSSLFLSALVLIPFCRIIYSIIFRFQVEWKGYDQVNRGQWAATISLIWEHIFVLSDRVKN